MDMNINYPDNNIDVVDPFNENDSREFRDMCLLFIQAYYPSLRQLFGLTLVDLVGYLRDSKYSGYPDEPGGSVWKSEGQFIYVMVRHLKPKNILEIGNYMGRGSTNHILQAVEDNKVGEVTLLDIMERLEYNKLHSQNFTRILDDSLKFLSKQTSYDFIVQDGCHEYEHVKKELELLYENNQQNFWIWSHDYYTVRPPECEIARSWESVKHLYQNLTPLKDKVSNCGFIVAQKIK